MMKPGPRDQGEAGAAQRYLADLGRFGSKPGLERIRALLERLGRPQERVPIVHVCGTNGKGSVASFLADLAQALGYRTGLYTSPHLEDYRERIQVQGSWLSPRQWNEALLTNIRPEAGAVAREVGEHPTEFEVLTALAFFCFARQRVDLAVVEAGMGGRLDATNVGRALGTVITRVDYDHRDVLGPALGDIAREKAALIKREEPVVAAAQHPEAEGVIKQRCRRQNSPLALSGRDFWSCSQRPLETGWSFGWEGPRFCQTGLRISRLGGHQVENSLLALAASRLFWNPAPARARRTREKEALRCSTWPGRMEFWPGKPPVLLDAAHNAPGITVLTRGLAQHFPGRPVTVLFSALADKDVAEMVRILSKVVKYAVISRAASVRAAEPEDIARMWKARGVTAQCAGDPARGLETGLARTPAQGLLVVCGSFSLVGPVRQCLRER